MTNLLHINDRAGTYPPSYYAATATPRTPFGKLQGEVRADICIIGAGYTGLSAALHLAQMGADVVLIEAHIAGFGASGRNGGQVGSGMRQDQDWLEAAYGLDAARRMWELAEDAKSLVKSLIANHNIAATWTPGVAHVARSEGTYRHAAQYAEKLAREYAYDQNTVWDAGQTRAALGSNAYLGGTLDHGAGHIHPLNYAIGLANAAAAAGVRIYENTEAHHIDRGAPNTVRTGAGRVICDTVILAGNGYLGGLHRKVAARVMPINNFIVATEPLDDPAILPQNIAVADDRFVVNYWRKSADGRLLFGGGESYGYRFPDIIPTVMKPLLLVYPQLRDVKIDYAWGGTLAITMTRMPNFLRDGSLFSVSGYSGHGVAMATLAGKMLANAVRGDAADFDLMARHTPPPFPGGAGFRSPLLAAAMTWYAMRDRLGV